MYSSTLSSISLVKLDEFAWLCWLTVGVVGGGPWPGWVWSLGWTGMIGFISYGQKDFPTSVKTFWASALSKSMLVEPNCTAEDEWNVSNP